MIFCSSGWGSVRKALWSKQSEDGAAISQDGETSHCVPFYAFFKNSFYLLLVELSLRCCTWTFSSFGKRGATLHCGVPVSHCGGFSCCGAWAVGA